MRSFTLFRTLLFIGLAGFISFSCDNELDSLAPEYQDIPVVYSVLELHRDTLCVRVTKTFLGPGSALNYTRSEDSVYYPSVRVWLEKWNGNFRVNKAELVKSKLQPREPGIFPENPNWNYLLIRSPETETFFSGSVSDQEYHLSVEIPGLPLIFAKTTAFPPARLTGPRLTSTHNLFLNPLEFSWTTQAPWSELYFRLYYSDVYADNTIDRCVTWREFHTLTIGQVTRDGVYGQDFMKRIAAQVKPDRLVEYRHVTGLQAVVAGIPEDLHDYRLMNQIQPPDQIGFPVTNIINGIGLFTSQTISAFDLNPDLKSKDSIMFGQYTKHLNFRYY